MVSMVVNREVGASSLPVSVASHRPGEIVAWWCHLAHRAAIGTRAPARFVS